MKFEWQECKDLEFKWQESKGLKVNDSKVYDRKVSDFFLIQESKWLEIL